MSYLPFLPPLSSFLPFFFTGSSFCCSADDRRGRRFLTASSSYTSGLRGCQGIFASCREKVALLWCGARYLTAVIAVAGLDGKPFALHAHFHAVVVRRPVRASWHVSDGVLVARFLADPRVKNFQRFALGREINFTAGVVRVVAQPRKFAFQ